MPFSLLPWASLSLQEQAAPLLFMGAPIEKVSSVYCRCFKLRALVLELVYMCMPIVCVCECVCVGMTVPMMKKLLLKETTTGSATDLVSLYCESGVNSDFFIVLSVYLSWTECKQLWQTVDRMLWWWWTMEIVIVAWTTSWLWSKPLLAHKHHSFVRAHISSLIFLLVT